MPAIGSQIQIPITHYRVTHSSVSDALLNHTEQSIMCDVCTWIRMQRTSRIGKGSPRCLIDDFVIYNVTRTWLGSQFSYEAAGLQVS